MKVDTIVKKLKQKNITIAAEDKLLKEYFTVNKYARIGFIGYISDVIKRFNIKSSGKVEIVLDCEGDWNRCDCCGFSELELKILIRQSNYDNNIMKRIEEFSLNHDYYVYLTTDFKNPQS